MQIQHKETSCLQFSTMSQITDRTAASKLFLILLLFLFSKTSSILQFISRPVWLLIFLAFNTLLLRCRHVSKSQFLLVNVQFLWPNTDSKNLVLLDWKYHKEKPWAKPCEKILTRIKIWYVPFLATTATGALLASCLSQQIGEVVRLVFGWGLRLAAFFFCFFFSFQPCVLCVCAVGQAGAARVCSGSKWGGWIMNESQGGGFKALKWNTWWSAFRPITQGKDLAQQYLPVDC